MASKTPVQVESSRKPWDFNRLIDTLNTFEVFPILSNLQRGLRTLTRQPQLPKGQAMGTILVVGATGGVGKRVIRRLVERKIPVRALVRDRKRAESILGKDIELFEADLTLPETLKAEMMQDVISVICCSGTRVQPVEGDTPNREKYYQGVKFYLPEVVDSPEMVEYNGMKNLIRKVAPYLGQASERMIFDFTNPSPSLRTTWGVIDDVVMGGVSASELRITPNCGLFTGEVSTANSGGFVSIRTKNFEPCLNLAGYEGISLRVQGDGKRYKFILRNESRWDGISYCYSFDTLNNTWMTVDIPFDRLIPVFRAKTLPSAPPFDPSQTYAIQLMLSKFEYDGDLNPRFSAGRFGLELGSIRAYGGPKLPKFVQISSAGVTRPGRPGLNLEEEPPAVRLNEQLGGILTWKLRGENVIRESGVPYTIIRPCALIETPGGNGLEVAQGDNIRGQVSREDIAELCLQVLSQPQACNLTFEVKAKQGEEMQDWDRLLLGLSQGN
jgi:uncharacterized protein YbjT (DUF2867 family)